MVGWASGIPAASVTVECGGETHMVIWRDGEFRVPAHPDPEAERALVALGGTPCRCVELLSAWERHAADPRVLILGPRGRGPLAPDPDIAYRFPAAGTGRAGNPRRPGTTVDDTSRDGLEELLELDGAIPHRLVATVAAALNERTGEPALWAALYSALFGRVAPIIRRWSHDDPEFVLEMTDGERRLEQTPEGGLLINLPFSWISEVWARELEIVAGEFVLSAEPVEPGILKVTTVDRAMVVHTQPPLAYD